jgi:THO complex subunit 5
MDEFLKLAPPEMRPPEIMTNDHKLMIQRLSFELAERQR